MTTKIMIKMLEKNTPVVLEIIQGEKVVESHKLSELGSEFSAYVYGNKYGGQTIRVREESVES